MTEIERIILSTLPNEFIDFADYKVSTNLSQLLAKAIEQYVIKARIEELENINIVVGNTNTDVDAQAVIFKVDIDRRIAQLKKGAK